MAESPKYIPEFPFKGNQVILSSDRIHLNGSKDSIILTGRKSVMISSLGSLNFESSQKCTLDAPRINIGVNATEALVLGTSFMRELRAFLLSIKFAGSLGQSSGESDIATTVSKLSVLATQMYEASNKLENALDGLLSTRSYTK